MLGLVPLIWLADQGSKWWVRESVPYQGRIDIIPGYFDLVHILNQGAAFGILADAGTWRSSFFYIVSLAAFVMIVVYYARLPAEERGTAVALTLVLGGLLGNLTDRIRFDGVVDFVSLHIQDYRVDVSFLGYPVRFALEWPAFNVADSAITIAMVLLVRGFFKEGGNR